MTRERLAPWLVTGSSGFIGGHICHRLGDGRHGEFQSLDIVPPPETRRHGFTRTDIRQPSELRRLADSDRPSGVIHLAAMAEVEIPFGDIPDLISTNVNGTAHVLAAFEPRKFVFASSSAVYGSSGQQPISVGDGAVRPEGIYGMSKHTAEMVCRDWVRHRGGEALSFRFGNVIGAGCRGLIPYLVRHAIRHPDGSEPAVIRGQGRLLRDYVPVRHTVEVLIAALLAPVTEGTAAVFNVGSGRGRTNGEIADLVRAALDRRGLRLRVCMDAPVLPGEAHEVVLESADTFRHFCVPAPGDAEVLQAVHEAVEHCVESEARE